MSTIHPHRKSVRDLLQNAEYGIDLYQREYEWTSRNVEELLEDFESLFMSAHDSTKQRKEVSKYPRYFLGTIITFEKQGMKQIVDGQQRLTTLTLLLTYFHHRRNTNGSVTDVSSLIYSETYGEKSFNIRVPERSACMEALYETGSFDPSNVTDLSVENLVKRYSDIQDLFPESLSDHALPYFVDWVIDNVDLVEIEAQTDNDAFTIFETMNDRGIGLGPVAMLKGYCLANISKTDDVHARDRANKANELWRKRIVELSSLESKEAQNFFKVWLRAKYADTARDRQLGASNRDFENIDKFHRWVRDNNAKVSLHDSQDFFEFITLQFDRYTRHYITLRHASRNLTDGLEEVYYNAYNNFTLQYMLALAPLQIDDDVEIVKRKMQLIAAFSDILIARRMVNRKSIGRKTLQYTMFRLVKKIRQVSIEELKKQLLDYLSNMEEHINGLRSSSEGPFQLHGRNSNHTKYLLARITVFVEQKSGMNTNFLTYTAKGQGKPYEIEHLWSDDYERDGDEFDSEDEFRRFRNYIGGLVLLPSGTNQSFGSDAYQEKVQHYHRENLLAASLHTDTYNKNPNFKNFMNDSQLPFKPHGQFAKDDLLQRQDLYSQICERIWSPERLHDI